MRTGVLKLWTEVPCSSLMLLSCTDPAHLNVLAVTLSASRYLAGKCSLHCCTDRWSPYSLSFKSYAHTHVPTRGGWSLPCDCCTVCSDAICIVGFPGSTAVVVAVGGIFCSAATAKRRHQLLSSVLFPCGDQSPRLQVALVVCL